MTQKTWKTILPAAAGLAAAIFGLPAAAHEGRHDQLAPLAGLRHLLTQPDHLAILAILVLLAGVPAGRLVLRRIRR
jgi:hydrogenase/urease accessory protein HupE